MRIKHFFGLAVLAAMTASCSSNNDLVNGGNGNGEITNEATEGYAAFNINLPSVSGTRAEGDPVFDEGDANEYDVNNATLLIFKAPASTTTTPTENDYTFVESVDLGSMEPWTDDTNTGVTTKAKIVAKLNTVNSSKEDLYALVILNNKDKNGALKVQMPTKPTETEAGQTYSNWNEAATSVDAAKFQDNTKGFYMANAPLFKDNKVTTLVKIDKTKIFPTEAKAAASVGNDIYVERGLAKVTMATVPEEAKTVKEGTYKNDKVDIANWGLDVTNLKTFPVHKADGTNYDDIWSNEGKTKRFVDNVSTSPVKRIYWGVDPNYSTDGLFAETPQGKTDREANFKFITNDKLTAGLNVAQYCLENTFNLDNMKQGQTTRVVFKGKYTPKSITSDPDGTFYKIGKNVALWNSTTLTAQITAAVTKVVTNASETNTKVTLTGTDITKAGNHVLTTANIKVNDIALTQPQVDAVNEKLGLTAESGISTFKEGYTYYIARVKHFGDALTPWKVDDPKYGTDNISFLGRYGMLRNNWYELKVNSVSGPGYPDVPEVKPNTPDDDDDKYVSVSVKILDWAKRSQNVDL